MVHFSCPSCRRPLKAPLHALNQPGTCPGCHAQFIVPRSQGELVPEPKEVIFSEDVAAEMPPVPAPPPRHLPDVYDDYEWEQESQSRRVRLLVLSLLVPAVAGIGLIVFLIAAHSSAEESKKVARATGSTSRRSSQPPAKTVGDGPRHEPDPAPLPSSDSVADDGERHHTPPVPPRPKPVVPPPKPKPNPDSPEPLPKEVPPDYDLERITELTRDLQKTAPANKRIQAARALGQFGPKARQASASLCEALLDERSPDLRRAAEEALRLIQPDLCRCLITLMVDKQIEQRAEAVRQIAQMGLEGRPALPVLIAHYQNRFQHWVEPIAAAGPRGRGPTMGAVLIEAMASLSPEDAALTARFVGWLGTGNDLQACQKILVFLPRMQDATHYAGTVVQILRRYADVSDAVGTAAAAALGEMQINTKEAVAALKAAQRSKYKEVREAAERALQQIELRQ